MSHSPLFRRFILALQSAREINLKSKNQPLPISYRQSKYSRRKFLKGAATLSAASLAVSCLPACGGSSSASQKETKVAIVGAGIAGLNAAYQLQKAGVEATVYEASSRVGGRMMSLTWENQYVIDVGGELINTDHDDMIALAEELNISLFNRKEDIDTANLPKIIYYFENEKITEKTLITDLQAIADQIAIDAALLDADWDTNAPIFDKMSVDDYLTKYSSKLPKTYLKKLFEEIIRTEYGAELKDSTALQLLFILPTIEGETVNLLSYSDETYSVIGGSSQITDALSNKLGDTISLNSALKKIYKQNDKYALIFNNRTTVLAEYVILAIPFPALKNVEMDIGFSDELNDFIANSALGANEKVFAKFNSRFWRTTDGFTDAIWCDQDFSEVWDATARQNLATGGILNFYFGGKKVEPLNKNLSMSTIGAILVNQLDSIVSGANDSVSSPYYKSDWLNNKYITGGYINYQPEMLTKYGDFFWIESDNPEEKQEVRTGNALLIGEHLSDEFYGFMNGGAQTGRLAAEALIAEISAAKKS